MNTVFNHVLVATDGSPLVDRALELAQRVAGGEARVTALLVMHDYGLPEYLRAALGRRPDALELRAEIAVEGRRLLDEAIARALGAAGASVERRVLISDKPPWQEILDLVQREACDLIVVAPHGIGGRMAGLLGSQSQAVLARATVPVLVVR